MRESHRLYYSVPELLETEARVLLVEEKDGTTLVTLDRTPFYPEGGGQPSDLGEIAGYKLDLVTEKDGLIRHRIPGKTSMQAGDGVICTVDAVRRRYHTQQHSGQHLLSAVLEREFSFHTVGFHLGENYCTIDITAAEFSRETFQLVEDLVEARITKPSGIKVHLCPPEDPSVFPLRKRLPEGENSLRIVEIDGYDWVPCCGTHVSTTAELRMVKILSAEKYKGGTRLYFISGDHAVKLMRQKFALLASAAGIAGCSQEELPARIAAQKAKQDSLDAERLDLLRARASLELGNAKDSCDLVAIIFAARKTEAVQESVRAGIARDVSVIAVSSIDKTVLAGVPPNSENGRTVHVGTLLKPILAQFGGSGGGGQGNFRASFKDEASCRRFFEASVAAMGGPDMKVCRLEL